jgi:hypothetical protein
MYFFKNDNTFASVVISIAVCSNLFLILGSASNSKSVTAASPYNEICIVPVGFHKQDEEEYSLLDQMDLSI